MTLKADNESLGESGGYTEPQLYEMITNVYSYVFGALWSERHVLMTNIATYSSILTHRSR